MTAVAETPRDRDWLLAALALVAAVISSALLLVSPPSVEAGGGELKRVVGKVSFSSGTLRRRPANRLGWSDLSSGAELRELDALFVPPGTEAKLTFTDGTVLELDERSLVVVESPLGGRRNVAVRQGSVEGSAAAGGLLLSTAAGTAQLPAGAQAHLEVNGEAVALGVSRGEATLGGQRILEGEHGGLSPTGALPQARWPATLLDPPRNYRQLFRGQPPHPTLRWSSEAGPHARLQLARDRGFAFVIEEHDAALGHCVANSAEAGVLWWRIVDPAGDPVSESRRFTQLEDVAPLALSPREAEVVLTDERALAIFAWSPVRGASRYRLEVSASSDFTAVAWSAAADSTQLRVSLALAEGGWFWRVRATDDEGTSYLPSVPRQFRLIHKPLPEAPELLNPQIEVVPAPRK